MLRLLILLAKYNYKYKNQYEQRADSSNYGWRCWYREGGAESEGTVKKKDRKKIEQSEKKIKEIKKLRKENKIEPKRLEESKRQKEDFKELLHTKKE